jgi:hypothetical protein
VGGRLVPVLAVAAAFFAAPGVALAAPAFVQTVGTSSVTDGLNTLTVTVGSAGVAAGDTLLVVGGKGNDQQALASVTDSRGNAYSVDRNFHGNAGSGMSMGVASGYLATGLSPGDTITVTYEGTASYSNRFGAVYDFSGVAPSGALDVGASATGYGSALTSSPTAATATDGELVFGLFNLQTLSTSFLAGSGYTALPSVTGSVVGQTLQPEWKVAGSAGVQEATASVSSFLSWQGLAVTYRSGTPPPPTPPANTVPPSISGTARAGSTLTAVNGTWTGTQPLAYSYVWQRCDATPTCTNVGTSSTYALTSADVGFTLQVAVTATNTAGSASATSAATAQIAPAPAPGASPQFVQTVATRSVVDTGNTLALTVPAAGVSAGDTVIVVGAKGKDQEAVASVADSRGNVYTVDRTVHGAAGSGISMSIASGYIATALQPGDTITITYEGTAAYTNRFGGAYEFSGLAPTGADVSATGAGYGSTVSVGPTGTTTQDSELAVSLFDVQSGGATFTAGAGQTALTSVNGAVVNQFLFPEFQVVSVAGAQSASGTLSALASYDSLLVTYRTGSAGPATSPSNSTLPTVSGTPRDGSTLTATPGTWTGSAPIAYAYQWQRCDATPTCTNVGTGLTYALTSADVGFNVRVAVTASNSAGSASATSAAVAVTAAPPVNTAPPALSGNAQVGSTLTATAGTWTGTQPLTFGYQWQRCDSSGANCSNITGAVGTSYAVVSTDVGATLRVIVTATNSAGSATTSVLSGVVVAVGPSTGPRFVKTIASGSVTNDTNNQLTLTVPAGGVAVGDTIIVVGSKASETQTIASVTDSRGNAYTVDLRVLDGAASGMGYAIASGFASTALAAGDTITITYEGTTSYTNRWGIAYEFAGLALNAADVTATSGGFGTQLSSGTTAATTQAGELVFGAFDVQQAAPTFTAGAGYQALTGAPSAAVAGQSLQSEFGVVSTTGTQTALATLAANKTWLGAAVTYRAATGPANTTPPNVTGSATQGSTLSTDNGTWSGTPPISYTYQWQRCSSEGSSCADLPGATASTYVVSSGDVGGTLRVKVTATNGAGSSTAPSSPTAVVAGAVAATPPVTANLELWFEANSETAADGTRLLRWHDKSGFGRDLTAATTSAAPIVHRSDANGRAALEFDGVTSLMKTYETAFSIPQPTTFFIVYKSLDPDTTTRAFVFDSVDSSVRQAFGRPAQGQIRIYANSDLDFPGITYPFGGFQIWTGTFAGVNSAIWQNGSLVGRGNAGGSALGTGLAVGGLSTSGTGGYDMSHFEVAEIIYYSATLSDADRQAVVNWLNLKYGSF